MSAGNRKHPMHHHLNSTKELPMKTSTTTKTAILLFVALLLGLAVSFFVPSKAYADDYCDHGNCPAQSVPQTTTYNPPSAPTCDAVIMEELNVLQIRDAYHINQIANKDQQIDELATDLMFAETKVFNLEWRVAKQAAKIKQLKALLGK